MTFTFFIVLHINGNVWCWVIQYAVLIIIFDYFQNYPVCDRDQTKVMKLAMPTRLDTIHEVSILDGMSFKHCMYFTVLVYEI